MKWNYYFKINPYIKLIKWNKYIHTISKILEDIAMNKITKC